MSHEHNGDCCGQHEAHHAIEQLHAHIGQLCCAGQCSHPEHQLAMLSEQQYYQGELANQDTKKKKKKKLGQFGLIQVETDAQFAL